MKETIMWDNYVRVPRPLCVSRICNQPSGRKRKNEVTDHFSLDDEAEPESKRRLIKALEVAADEREEVTQTSVRKVLLILPTSTF